MTLKSELLENLMLKEVEMLKWKHLIDKIRACQIKYCGILEFLAEYTGLKLDQKLIIPSFKPIFIMLNNCTHKFNWLWCIDKLVLNMAFKMVSKYNKN